MSTLLESGSSRWKLLEAWNGDKSWLAWRALTMNNATPTTNTNIGSDGRNGSFDASFSCYVCVPCVQFLIFPGVVRSGDGAKWAAESRMSWCPSPRIARLIDHWPVASKSSLFICRRRCEPERRFRLISLLMQCNVAAVSSRAPALIRMNSINQSINQKSFKWFK